VLESGAVKRQINIHSGSARGASLYSRKNPYFSANRVGNRVYDGEKMAYYIIHL